MPFSLPLATHSASSQQYKRYLLLRIVDAISETDRFWAEREIARYGGQFTTVSADHQ